MSEISPDLAATLPGTVARLIVVARRQGGDYRHGARILGDAVGASMAVALIKQAHVHANEPAPSDAELQSWICGTPPQTPGQGSTS